MSDFSGDKYKKSGEPTSQYMKWLYENDVEKFESLQGEHFTTKAKMKDNALKDAVNKIMRKKK